MRIKKGTPGKGDEPRAEQFTNWKVLPSTKTQDAWCAGDPYWCVAHRHTDAEPGTKVCLQWATDGELKCPRCRPKSKREWVAYVPLYRDLDNKAMFCVCHETVKDLLDNLFFGVAVYVGRVEKDASIFVKRSVVEKRYTSSMPTRQKACDLSETLLNLWAYPHYEDWIAAKEAAAKEAANGPKVPKLKPLRSDGHPFGPMTRAAADRYVTDNSSSTNDVFEPPPPEVEVSDNQPAGSVDVDDALNGALRRARNKPSANGTH